VCDISSAARNFAAVKLAKRNGATVLLVVQGQRLVDMRESLLRRWWIGWAERSVIGQADLILANSQFSASTTELCRKPSAGIIIAPPGLESAPVAESRDYSSDGPLNLLYVGECSRVKGLAYLVEAMAGLEPSVAKLDIAGGHSQEPNYFEEIQHMVARHNLKDRISFHGFVDRDWLESLYRTADVLVVPSLSEGYGMVVAEAYCHGLPVIASDAGALIEIIRDNENGLLVPPADAAALRRTIKRMAADRSLCVRFSRTNLEYAPSLPTWSDFENRLDRELAPLLLRRI
jgi:glycosyltransferase involved in cell wall biosynthesis